MFEYVKTAKGWRIFWGIDPLVGARVCAQPTASWIVASTDRLQQALTQPVKVEKAATEAGKTMA